MIKQFYVNNAILVKTAFLCFALTLSGCGERNGAITVEQPLALSDPNKFSEYFNAFPGLAAGDYKIVATTLAAGESAAYTLSITKDGEAAETMTGSWGSSIGASVPFDIANYDIAQIYNFSLTKPGGINIKLEADAVDTFIYLLDRNDTVLFDSATSYPGVTQAGPAVTSVEIDLPVSISLSQDYAEAYYAAIDPNNDRDTLYKWRTGNCFNNDPTDNFGADIHVIFRDTKDLGYGRNMYWKFGCDGNGGEDLQPGAVAVFVENFNVVLVPGFPYTTLNLDAAIANDRAHHFGSNAIEFNDWSGGVNGGVKFNKFYTFRPVSEADDADELRLSMVNLDDRGGKAMPIPCIYCHGGAALPLQANGEFYINPLTGIQGNTNAKLQLLDINTLEFVATGEFTREQQEAKLKQLNQAVYCTYPGAAESTFCSQPNGFNTNFEATALSSAGEWTGDYLREVAQGWYDTDTMSKEFPSEQYNGDAVPSGWDPNNIANAANPAGIDRLYLDVIKPTCLVCHGRQGSNLGTNGNPAKDIDFSSYDRFISYASRIEELVYDRGRMPLSLLGFETFWETDQPTILASFLPNFSHYDADGNVIEPGRPFADAGPDRQVNVPVHVSGEGSEFADSYLWQLTDSPAGSTPVLTNETSARVKFDTDVDGFYTLELTVSQGSLSHTDSMQLLKINTLKLPATLTFDADIAPLVGAAGSLGCDSCHSDTAVTPGIQGALPGVPVAWDGSGDESAYRSVMSRVYLNDPADSLFLRKPTGDHHFGGTLIDRNTISGELHYNTVLSWIIEGAIEK